MKKKNKGTKRRAKQQVRCPYCGAIADLRPASEIYHDESRTDMLYVCRNYPRCKAYVGTYAGTDVPLGPLANGELRHLRIRAHRIFDQIWKQGIMTRDNAYRWLADSFGLRKQDAHIGHMGEYGCRQLIEKCENVLSNYARVG